MINFATVNLVQQHIFLEVAVRVSFLLARKWFLRGEKDPENSALQVVLLKEKPMSATKKFETFLYQLGVGKPSSTTYFVQVGARVSLKLANKVFLRGKKSHENIAFQVALLKEKCMSTAKNFETFLISLASVNLFQLHIF